MLTLDPEQQVAADWFQALQHRLCAAFEAIEREAGSDAAFAFLPSRRVDADGGDGGGGTRGVMKGRVFEKVGVNFSAVAGRFSDDFAKTMPGAEDDPRFFATGISLVAHMANPHVPAAHMNTRLITTTRRWFAGVADLNPPLPRADDTALFHDAMRDACEAHPGPGDYARYKAWADDYFWIPHRQRHRGAGGIFYDQLEGDFDAGFAFTRAVGEAFLDVFPRIVRTRMHDAADDADRQAMLEFRGRYAEFNLVYDRGTLFGLKTGHDPEAVLMSLPPLAAWS